MFVQKQLGMVQHIWFQGRKDELSRVWKEVEAPKQAILLRKCRRQKEIKAWIEEYSLFSRDNDRVEWWLFIKCFLLH